MSDAQLLAERLSSLQYDSGVELTPKDAAFNQTVTLRDTWAKIEKKMGAPGK